MQSPRIFVTPDFVELPSWFDLYIDFYNFKVCGEHPIYWGRDATLRQRPLGHIQLTNSPLILARWSSISDPFYRTVKATEADYDQWLLPASAEPEHGKQPLPQWLCREVQGVWWQDREGREVSGC